MPKSRTNRTVIHGSSGRTLTVNGKRATSMEMVGEGGKHQRQRTQEFAAVQGLIMPAMVAVGCWGLAIFFAVFSIDPNRLLFAGMVVLMALMWSFTFWSRLRKLMRRR